MDYKHERVSETDPNRCQGITANGQCIYKAVDGGKMCLAHGGGKERAELKKHGLRNYQLQQYGERVGQLANSDEIKSLREEIGILRMTLESTLNNLKNPNQLLIYSDKITLMVGQIQRLVEAAQKMEERNGNLLDRKVVIIIADSITTIVGQYVTDPDALNVIAEKICESIIAAGNGAANPRRVIAESHNGAFPVGV